MSTTTGLKKLLSLSVLGLAMTISNQATAGSIIGSAHDFSKTAAGGATQWSTQICLACHTPHSANNAQGAPLWGHDLTQAAFTLYTGITDAAGVPTTLNATLTQPTGTSLLCLSCHDGTVAVDSFGGAVGTQFIKNRVGKSANLTSNLSNDHPISFVYDATLAKSDGSLYDPTVALSNMKGKNSPIKPGGGTIATDLLEGGTRLECSSCHDVHNTFTGAANPTATTSNQLLVVEIAGSKLCLTCHNK